MGLRPPVPSAGRPFDANPRRPGLLADGTFRTDTRDGLDSRDVGVLATMIQLERMSPSPFWRCTFFDGRDGLTWSCDMYSEMKSSSGNWPGILVVALCRSRWLSHFSSMSCHTLCAPTCDDDNEDPI